ncbi:unnamed protein product [Pedinophyceae sp. YPF-701]|nr:unnamed protein product [Pedinophyceae sp. YPF-701]
MLAQCCCAAARRGTMTDRRCRPGLLLTLFMATLALISMCAAAPDALARREQRHSGTRPLDLFVRLTSQLRFAINPHIGRTYFMQRNVQACADAVAAQSDVAAFYGLDARKTFCHTDTLPGSEEEPLTVCYYDYTEGSTYGETLRAQVNGMELALSLLLTSGALQALDDDGLAPAIMFDIDNTLQFTAQNDTDWFGLAPAIRETAAFAQRNCAGLGPSGYGPHAGQFTCYFITARGCSKSKAFATRRFVRAAFPYASDDWIDGHVLLSGGLTGCGSWSTAYKDVLRAWLEDNRGVRFVMSVGDSQSDFYGAHSGMKVHLVNSFAATNKVPEWPSSDLPWKQQYRRRDWGEKCDPHIAAPRIADDACYDAALASDDVFEAARLAHCSECEEPEELPWGRGGCKLDISALAGRGGRSSRRSRGAAARAEDVGARVVGDGRAALDLYWALVSHTRYVLEPHIGRSHIMALNVQQCRDAIAEKSGAPARDANAVCRVPQLTRAPARDR